MRCGQKLAVITWLRPNRISKPDCLRSYARQMVDSSGFVFCVATVATVLKCALVTIAFSQLDGVMLASPQSTEGFYAYYTKVQSKEPFERFCRTGTDADARQRKTTVVQQRV